MPKKRYSLPSLDLLKGFEAAARNLSFTKAAEELFVTQSAVSRQIMVLEEHLGVALFRRRHRALLLTDEGQILYRTVANVLAQLQETADRLRGQVSVAMLTVTTTVSFASLWLIPRLSSFRKVCPGVDVRISAVNDLLHLERENVDLAIRFCEPDAAPPGAIRLFGEELFPVCSKSLLKDRSRPLKEPADLRHHVLLHLDDAGAMRASIHWPMWLEANGVASIKPAGALHFSHYDQAIQAAVDGQGVALGRTPLIGRLIRQGKLVAPLKRRAASARSYFVIRSAKPDAGEQRERFIRWLLEETKADEKSAVRM